jgi:hypothetical protein
MLHIHITLTKAKHIDTVILTIHAENMVIIIQDQMW